MFMQRASPIVFLVLFFSVKLHGALGEVNDLEAEYAAKKAELDAALDRLKILQRNANGQQGDVPRSGTSGSVSPPLDESSDRPMAAYMKWLREDRGVSMRYVEVRKSRVTKGWGVFAKRDIPKNKVFLTIPASSSITMSTVLKSKVGKIVKTERVQDVKQALALYALVYRRDGDQSFFPFVTSWPLAYEDAASYPDSVTEMFNGTIAYEYVKLAKAKFQRELSFLTERLCVKYPDIFTSDICTKDALLWAHSTIETRAFREPEAAVPQAELESMSLRTRASRSALIPVMCDMNHSPTKGLPLLYSSHTKSYQLASLDKVIKRGTELFMSYSELTDTETLIKYGFIWDYELSNPFDNIKWIHSMWTGEVPEAERRNAIARELGLEYPYEVPTVVMHEFPNAIVLAVHIYNLSPRDLTAYSMNDTYGICAVKQTIDEMSYHISRYPVPTAKDADALATGNCGGSVLECDITWLRHHEQTALRLGMLHLQSELPYMIEDYCSQDENAKLDIWTCADQK